ncbi:DUF1622 domain-containing protein [Acutalibacter muris]|uniref:DUF1622 domain-containing protein n=1 Tax=Acutalibacter muris TaxID=1796620 RepID=A0A1Z2XM25_9FIRM|nr:hypothetical protein A4V00_07250 [Hungateiclostridiaceae bacterium KB18]ASB39481.1 hypothetical protein ADH66_01710 [Acutalibacter muris]QQR28771.1 DUF1622 domain-containing protein [Acutalibacter muris]
MEAFTAGFAELLDGIVGVAIHCFEFIGVVIIVVAGVKGLAQYVRKDPSVRLQLAQGMALGLEFKLGSEILRTVVVRELSEVALVAAIIAVRAALTFLIHWEIRIEERTKQETKEGEEGKGLSEKET